MLRTRSSYTKSFPGFVSCKCRAHPGKSPYPLSKPLGFR